MKASDCCLYIEGLSAGYGGNKIIDKVSLCVKKGIFLGIIGPNGAGKTTLFKAILGIIPRIEGEALVFGRPVDVMRHKIGYVPQYLHTDILAPLSVEDMVGLGFVGIKQGRDERKREIEHALDRVFLSHMRKRKYNTLSMGEKQRVLIARALVKRPELLLLDEPTASLDEPSEKGLFALLDSLKKEGITIIMISHDIGVLSYVVDEVACLNRRLVYHGKPGEELASGIEEAYSCPVDVLAHGVPHRVLKDHT